MRVAVVTGTRAEYGILRHLMQKISDSSRLDLLTLVTGAHLSQNFGETWKQIAADGFSIDAKIPLPLEDDSSEGIADAMAQAISGFAQAYQRLTPDMIVVLGDRYEVFAAAAAAIPFGIPLAHIHGGEVTEGAIDEVFRHSITKMANLHFVACAPYRSRVIQMGERPERVHLVGAPGLDTLSSCKTFNRAMVEARLGIELTTPSLLVTYHPVTTNADRGVDGARALIQALDELSDATVILTGVNADGGSQEIRKLLHGFLERNHRRARWVESLGSDLYLSTAKLVDVVVGNSSSGIIEIPSLGTATVNIGDRQKGRLRAPSIIDCGESLREIVEAVRKATSPEFHSIAQKAENPYGGPGASARIVAILEGIDPRSLGRKPFFDLPGGVSDEASA